MGLRDRLRGRQRPHSVYRLQVDDPTEAERELRQARDSHRRALKDGDTERTARLSARVDEARAALESCFEEITFRAVPPSDLEALIAAHPPEDDGENASWNAETFPFALFVASVESEDMAEEDWRQLLDHDVSHGEKLEMMLLAQSVNVRAPSPQIPKD